MEINEFVRKLAMAGVGAVSFTVEKSKELVDSLIKKGESAADDKNINYEEIRDKLAAQLSALSEKMRAEIDQASFDELLSRVDELTDEQRALLLERLTAPRADQNPTAEEAAEAYAEHAADERSENSTPEGETGEG